MTTTKTTIDARVKITAGPAANQYGRIRSFDESTWTADVTLDDGRIAKDIPMKHFDVIEEATISDRQRLLDRVRKLFAKAESAKALGNLAEAEAFAAGVQKMLAKYKLDMSELEMTTVERDDPMGTTFSAGTKRHRTPWVERLAHAVSLAHYCRFLVFHGSDAISFVGRSTDRTIAAFVFETLRRTAEELSDTEARRFRKQQRRQHGATTGENRQFRLAWLDGFVTRIQERYTLEEVEIKRQAIASKALVRLDQSHAAVAKFMSDTMHVRNARSIRERVSANDAGRAAGRAAADRANLRGTALDAPAPSSTKRLGR